MFVPRTDRKVFPDDFLGSKFIPFIDISVTDVRFNGKRTGGLRSWFGNVKLTHPKKKRMDYVVSVAEEVSFEEGQLSWNRSLRSSRKSQCTEKMNVQIIKRVEILLLSTKHSSKEDHKWTWTTLSLICCSANLSHWTIVFTVLSPLSACHLQ